MLKKGITIFLVVLLGSTLLTSPAFASLKVYDYLKTVKLYIGQKNAEVNFSPETMDQAAYVKDGRTLIPLRFLGESLGAQIDWDSVKKQAILNLADTEVKVLIGSKVAYVNGNVYKLDVPAETQGGRTFIPLRFVSEALGATVDYEADNQQVTVTYVDTSNWKEYTNSKNLTYIYPPDWNVVVDKDTGRFYFISPNGSNCWSATQKNMNVKQTIETVKKEWQNSEHDFEAEIVLDKKNPSEGSMLVFSSKSGDETDYIFVEKQEGTEDALITKETIKQGFDEIDGPIITKIVFD